MSSGKRLIIPPCATADSQRLVESVGISRVLADALVRRGWTDPAAVIDFLELEGSLHDPLLLGDASVAIPLLQTAIADRSQIVVHGDYDADGVCSTALLCEGLAALGATVRPFIPSRFDEGYGLAVETVERLHAEGAQLIVTVDCGITAVEAAERAAALGVTLIITDHHRQADSLPTCPIVAPALRDQYPFAALCGAGTAYKLLEGLVAACQADPAILDGVVDLVAIATIADLVPLIDENRSLTRRGLRRIGEGRRLGLEALLKVAKVDKRVIDAGAIGFRVGPRLNAAGRLEHADAALRLMMTQDPREAHELAEQLDSLNRRRRAIEDRILREAIDVYEASPQSRQDALGIVLASDGWHAGVVGIVASRVVERLRRPVVLVALDGEQGQGSGRSIEAFDLHAALAVCDPYLERWGGHRAAAGVSVRTDQVDAFAEAFAAHATATLQGADLRSTERIDAVISLTDVTIEVATDLARLDPVGMGNPAVTVMIPAAELTDVRRIGSEGKHIDMRVRTAAGSCRAVAWSSGDRFDELASGARMDVAARVERSVWQGAERVELITRTVQPLPADLPVPLGLCLTPCDHTCQLLRESPLEEQQCLAEGVAIEAMRDARDGGAIAELTRLAAAGAGVLIVVAEVARRRSMLSAALHPERFELSGALLFSRLCSEASITERSQRLLEGSWIALIDHDTLTAHPELAEHFVDAVLLDPPRGAWLAPAGPNWVRVDGVAEQRFAASAYGAPD